MIRYAPIIEGTIPAFTSISGIRVPFQHNKAVDWQDVECMVLRIKDLRGNIIGYLVSNKNKIDIDNNIATFFNNNSKYEDFIKDNPNKITDTDGDGKTDYEDAIYLLFHVNFPDKYPLKDEYGIEIPSNDEATLIKYYDYNGDKKVNLDDPIFLLQFFSIQQEFLRVG